MGLLTAAAILGLLAVLVLLHLSERAGRPNFHVRNARTRESTGAGTCYAGPGSHCAEPSTSSQNGA